MPSGIDTLQIDCKLLKLFSICLKGFFCLRGLHVRYIRRCVCRHHHWGFLIYENLPPPHPTPWLHLFSGFTMSIQQKTHQIGCLLSSLRLKTDDSKYNYKHFLLLLRPFLRASANPISSSGHDDVNTYRWKGGDGKIERLWWLIRQAMVESS